MTERCFRMRSSFVKVGNKRRPAALFLTLIFVLLFLSGCNLTGPGDPVPEDRINDAPENVARVYAEAVFTGNYLLMFKCYPREFITKFGEDDLQKSAAWGRQISDALLLNAIDFHGTKAKTNEIKNDDQSSIYQDTLRGIEEKASIDSKDVEKIYQCEVNLYFDRDGEDKYQTVSVIVYSYDDAWYVYQMEAINL